MTPTPPISNAAARRELKATIESWLTEEREAEGYATIHRRDLNSAMDKARNARAQITKLSARLESLAVDTRFAMVRSLKQNISEGWVDDVLRAIRMRNHAQLADAGRRYAIPEPVLTAIDRGEWLLAETEFWKDVTYRPDLAEVFEAQRTTGA